MIRAGSLLYAIYICLLISILIGSLILIFNFKLDFSSKQLIKNELINRCDSCIKYYLSSNKDIQSSRNSSVNIFDDGINCNFVQSQWGLYTILQTKAYFKKDTISKNSLIGTVQNKNNLALYLCDWGEELKISGNTSIKGDLHLPTKSYKTINLLGNSQLNKPNIQGDISISNQVLPKLSLTKNEYKKGVKKINFLDIKNKDFIFNNFTKPPLLIELNEGDKINNLRIKGNIILRSNDTLYINKSSILEDIIIEAPKVVFEKGFKGNVQVFAANEVILEEDVILDYPSSIRVYSNTEGHNKKITLLKNAKIYGGLVLDSENFDEKENGEITLGEKSLVVGDIYCNAKLELKGKVFGSVYAHKLKLETKSGSYQTVILNGKIDVNKIPKKFARLTFLLNTSNKTYGLIKNL